MNKKLFFLFLLIPSLACPAMKFNGTNQYVNFQGQTNPASFTITGWVNQATTASYQTIYANNTNGIWLLNGVLDWYDSGDHLGTATLPINAWSFVAVTYSPGALTYYVNGVLDKTTLFSISGFPTGTTAGIGGHGGDYFNGMIDDERIYNRVLSMAEIQSLGLSRERLPITDGIVMWQRFDNCTIGAPQASSSTYNSAFNLGDNGNPINGPVCVGGILKNL